MKGFSGSIVARPVFDLVLKRDASGIVRGSGSMAAYIEVSDLVIAVTGRTVPAMPNGIVVMQQHGLQAFQSGSPVEIDRDGIRSADVRVSLIRPRVWDPLVPQWANSAGELLDTAREMWWRLRLARTVEPLEMVDRLARGGYATASEVDGRVGLELLFRSVGECDPEHARRAAALLLGRGPGLTPEGDDFLAAALAALRACERSTGWTHEEVGAWRSAVLPDDLRKRTTALSATLLEFAERGYVSEPVQTLFDVGAPFEEWLRELNRLKRVGHGTGRAWAAGCAATTILLTCDAA